MTPRRERKTSGFTLFELLIVISIIAVFSSLALMVLRDAQNTSRHARSASLVGRIQAIIAAKLEDFETRQLPFRFSSFTSNPNWNDQRRIRQRAILDWIRSELPMKKSDAPEFRSDGNYADLPVEDGWDETWKVGYLDLFRTSTAAQSVRRTLDGMERDEDKKGDEEKEEAKCLYAILYNTWHDDSRAIGVCGGNEIGTDLADGKKYIQDSFGEALRFRVFWDVNEDGVFNGNDLDIEQILRSLDDPPPLPPAPRFLDFRQLTVQVFYARQFEK